MTSAVEVVLPYLEEEFKSTLDLLLLLQAKMQSLLQASTL